MTGEVNWALIRLGRERYEPDLPAEQALTMALANRVPYDRAPPPFGPWESVCGHELPAAT
jgi:hypothetical protein